jgi:hypothetical protein
MPDKRYTPSQTLLLSCLKNPENVAKLSVGQWSLLLRMARVCKLVAHLAWLIGQHKLSHHVPEKVNNHFQAAHAVIAYRRRMAFWEMNRLQRALAGINTDIIALKGCAYLLMGIPFADTRVFADVDLMVDKSQIDSVEKTLLDKNWQPLKLDDYDQYYYRQWMHEIPPLCHYSREMEVDIHHTIIPTTSALQPDPKRLLRDAIAIDSNTRFKVLAPCDMLLHSAVHLFFDSDLNNKLRDLVDLDQLLRHFSATDNNFFQALLLRAQELGLQRPLYYGLRYSHGLLDTPVPDGILLHSQTFAPPLVMRALMDHLVPIALLPEHPDDASKTAAFARWLLFIRSHYLRMPLKLLIPHLTRKSWVRLTHKESVN